jgi:hypothetical protein
VWYGLVTVLSGGARDWRRSAKTVGAFIRALLGNLLPSGKRTSIYSIQWLARRHPDWFRSDLATLLTMLDANEIAPRIAAVRTLDEVPIALMTLASHPPPGKQVIAIPGTKFTSDAHRST